MSTLSKPPKQRHWLRLLLAVGAAGSTLFGSLPVLSSSKVTIVSPAEAAQKAKSGQWKVLDVRPVPGLDYLAGHIPGAVHVSEQAFRGPNGRLPFQIWPSADLARILSSSGISNNDSVLVYSDGSNVLGATLVAYVLEKSGVPTVGVVDGGYKGYKSAGLPTSQAFPTYSSGNFRPNEVSSLNISLKELVPLIGRNDVAIVDPRPPEQFAGNDNNTFQRSGHIPGAINIPWPLLTQAANSQEDLRNPHRFLDTAKLRELFVIRGVTPDKQIIISCSTGREATLQYIVLKHVLGYPNVRVYEGSWTEYSASTYPVSTGPGVARLGSPQTSPESALKLPR